MKLSILGSSLEQIHIFAMSHILRRPIIVYGIKYVKSYRGDNIGLARFQGVYLPLLCETTFCWTSPLALGYTRGHFSALVCMSSQSLVATSAWRVFTAAGQVAILIQALLGDYVNIIFFYNFAKFVRNQILVNSLYHRYEMLSDVGNVLRIMNELSYDGHCRGYQI